VDDLVSEFLFRFVKNIRRTQLPVLVHEWVELEDSALLARLRYRFKLLASEIGGRWPLLKALRHHVAAVIEEAPSFALLPTSLMEHDRISRRLVAQAVGHLRASGETEAWTVRTLSTRLLNHYFPPNAALHDDLWVLPEVDQELEAFQDAATLAADVASHLGDEQAELLARRAQGEGYADLAKRRRRSLSTVHAQVEKACGVFRLRASVHRASYEVTLQAVHELQRRLLPTAEKQ
jgi:hypothetical protein